MQNWLNANSFIEKTEWPSSSPDLNPLDYMYHIWGAMLEKCHKPQPKPKTSEELPQEHFNKAVANFTKWLTAYMAVAANVSHSKHLQ